jgi:small multidrug resistance pump
MNAWVLLALAILCEIAGTSLLKASQGFAKPLFGMASMSCYGLCFWLLAFAFTRIPMGIAYAIWSGVGVVAVAVIGWLVFRQSISLAQAGFIVLTLVGTTGLYLTTPYAEAEKQQATAEG